MWRGGGWFLPALDCCAEGRRGRLEAEEGIVFSFPEFPIGSGLALPQGCHRRLLSIEENVVGEHYYLPERSLSRTSNSHFTAPYRDSGLIQPSMHPTTESPAAGDANCVRWRITVTEVRI